MVYKIGKFQIFLIELWESRHVHRSLILLGLLMLSIVVGVDCACIVLLLLIMVIRNVGGLAEEVLQLIDAPYFWQGLKREALNFKQLLAYFYGFQSSILIIKLEVRLFSTN